MGRKQRGERYEQEGCRNRYRWLGAQGHFYPLSFFQGHFYKVFGRGMEAKVPGIVCLCFQGERACLSSFAILVV